MKTYLKLSITLTVCLAVFISLIYLRANHMKSQEAFLLNNIEALAEGESDFVKCIGTGKVDCPFNHEKVIYVLL